MDNNNYDKLSNCHYVPIMGCMCTKVDGKYYWNNILIGVKYSEAEESIKELINKLLDGKKHKEEKMG